MIALSAVQYIFSNYTKLGVTVELADLEFSCTKIFANHLF